MDGSRALDCGHSQSIIRPFHRRTKAGSDVPVTGLAQIEIFAGHTLVPHVDDHRVTRRTFACVPVVLLCDRVRQIGGSATWRKIEKGGMDTYQRPPTLLVPRPSRSTHAAAAPSVMRFLSIAITRAARPPDLVAIRTVPDAPG